MSVDNPRGARKEPRVTASNSPMNSSMAPLLDPRSWSLIQLGIIGICSHEELGEKVLDSSHNNQPLHAVLQRPQTGSGVLKEIF